MNAITALTQGNEQNAMRHAREGADHLSIVTGHLSDLERDLRKARDQEEILTEKLCRTRHIRYQGEERVPYRDPRQAIERIQAQIGDYRTLLVVPLAEKADFEALLEAAHAEPDA